MSSICLGLGGKRPATEQSPSDQPEPSLAYQRVIQTLADTARATASSAPDDAPTGATRNESPGSPKAYVPADERLRTIIESAPVGLILASSDGNVLAANQAALGLLGAERFSDVRGRPLSGFVVADHRQAITDLLARVCHGETDSLECDLAGPDHARRAVEARGVPLQREATGPAVFLGAIWDTSTRAAAFEQELVRFESALSDANQERIHLASQWAADRDALHSQLRESETLRTELAAQLLAARTAQTTLEEIQHEHESVVARLREEARQRENACAATVAQADELASTYRTERDALAARVDELKDRLAQLVAERDALTQSVETQQAWQLDAAQALRVITELCGRLLNHGEGLPQGDTRPHLANVSEGLAGIPHGEPDSRPPEDRQWEF